MLLLKFKLLLLIFVVCLCFNISFIPTNIVYASPTSKAIENIKKPIIILKDRIKKINKKSATAKATGGSSTILRERLKSPPGFAAHHVIPVQLKNHRVLNKIGMDMDEVTNGISLPQYPGLDPKLPLHRGSHPEYTLAVKKALDNIPENLSVAETRKRVLEIQSHFRKQLESGKPLHSSQGGGW